MASFVVNLSFGFARNFILAESSQLRSSPLLEAATRYASAWQTRILNEKIKYNQKKYYGIIQTKGKKTMSYFMDLLVDLDKNCTDDVLRVTRDVEESTDINSTDRQKLLFALKEGTY